MPSPDWSEYQALFSDLDPVLWLNHAGVSPISRPVADAMKKHADEVAREGASNVVSWYSGVKKVKQLAASLLRCEAHDLSITPNTTHGVNLVANGLDWKEGDEVLLPQIEYPANVYPWWAQESKGVKLVWVPPDRDGRIPVEAFESRITDRTRVLTVSFVQFASGYRHDLQALGNLCKDAGIFYFVDAIQGFSVFDIDVQATHIDALTTGAHKWLLGPTGVALFYTTPETREALAVNWVGADCMVDALNYLDYKFELLPDGRRYENAMINFHGVSGVHAALQVVDQFGRDRIETKIHEATQQLSEKLLDLGFVIHSPRGDGEWSGILSVTHPKVPSEELAGLLRQESIITSVRDNRWRLSPHAYHTREQFERIEKALERAVGKG